MPSQLFPARHRPLFAVPLPAESQFRFGEDSAHAFAIAVRASGTLASLEVSPTSGTLISARWCLLVWVSGNKGSWVKCANVKDKM